MTGPPRVGPLVWSTLASQALLVVLGPTLVAIGDDLGAPTGVVGQARSVTAAAAVIAALTLNSRVGVIGVPRLLSAGAALAIVASAAVAAAPALPVFLAAHVLVGLAFACLLSAGFAGVAAFPAAGRARAMGQVAGANALAWILVNPAVGALTGVASWRVAEVVPAAIAAGALATAPAASGVPGGRGSAGWRDLLAATSARRWIGAELLAYAAWSSLLTFIGAYFIASLGVPAPAAGWLLAAGAAAYLLASMRSAAVLTGRSHRVVVAVAAALMAALAGLLFRTGGSVALTAGMFCLVGLAAGVRTPASGGLGLEQLPGQPATMMVARTAATQLGYLLGAVVGGAVIGGAGYGAFGLVLAAGLAASAVLMLRVPDASGAEAVTPTAGAATVSHTAARPRRAAG